MIQVLLLLTLSLQTTPMKFTTVARSGDSQIETARTAVARTPAEWTALWKEHSPETKPPAVNFNGSMVIAVFSGTRPTAGHTVEVISIEESGAGIVVTYRERAPGPDEMVAQVLTAPFHIVRTDARPGKVTFNRAGTPRR